MTWIQRLGGGPLDILDPRPEQLDVEEIAHSLALINRYNGHTRRPYSVAEHSLLVADILAHWDQPAPVQFAGLMHDCAETLIGDVVSPLKQQLACYPRGPKLGLSEIETRFLRVAAQKFGFPWSRSVGFPGSESSWVDRADGFALGVERTHLLAPSERPWGVPIPQNLWLKDFSLPEQDQDWREIRDKFLARFDALGGVR